MLESFKVKCYTTLADAPDFINFSRDEKEKNISHPYIGCTDIYFTGTLYIFLLQGQLITLGMDSIY